MSETPNEGAGGVSVEGQDERGDAAWERFHGNGPDTHGTRQVFVAGRASALVESEARERARDLALAKRLIAAREREAVLVEALNGAEDFIERVEQWSGVDPDEVHEALAAIRSALAGVVEAEPDGSER